MKLQEAIEINKTLTRVFRARLNVYERDAVKLGIEALKAVTLTRQPNNLFGLPRLPGETKD